ncbi:MAG TPA: GNAT family protein [Thermoanaerobaculia bacterium]|nr:GNAT family protein [Thermoanaerobaculia bacterium]
MPENRPDIPADIERTPDPKSSDVRLRDVTESDLPILFEQQLDPEANQMAAFAAREWDAFMAHWTRLLSDTATVKKTILFEGQVAGNIGKFEQSGQPLVGYWIGKQYWGKGIATKALAALLDHVKERPLYAHVAKHNVASIRVLEKCGFTICGEDKGDSSSGGDEVEEVVLVLAAT